jgi:hypothetical protein
LLALTQLQTYGDDLPRLHKRFPPAILPRAFGGTLDPWEPLQLYTEAMKRLPEA